MKTRVTMGVCGGTGSGKTTFSQRLAESLGPEQALILSQDAYYCDGSHLSSEKRAQRNFDRPEAVDFELLIRHLKQLREGREIARPKYDFKRHLRLAESELVSPRPLILVEGTLVFAQAELVRCFDLKVFVDAPPDIRFIRRLRRTQGNGVGASNRLSGNIFRPCGPCTCVSLSRRGGKPTG